MNTLVRPTSLLSLLCAAVLVSACPDAPAEGEGEGEGEGDVGEGEGEAGEGEGEGEDLTAPPRVASTDPADDAVNVDVNVNPSATFNKIMDGGSLVAETTFTLTKGGVLVPGRVTTFGRTATFRPDDLLTVGTIYTGTITTGARDEDGHPVETEVTWDFTTAGDDAPPQVVSVSPINNEIGVSIHRLLKVRFTKAMSAASINDGTFLVLQGATPIAGDVGYDVDTNTGTFRADVAFDPSLPYSATITTGVTDDDAAPHALESAFSWNFTTGACTQEPITLGAAGAFAVLAGTAVTNSGVSNVTGDVGTSPGVDITGFPAGELVGTQHAADATAIAGAAALSSAFDDAAGRTLCPIAVTALAGTPNLGGRTLSPGLYKSESGIDIAAFDLTLDAGGDDDAIFIFQVASELSTTANRTVQLTNGAQAQNVFWQVGTSATLGAGTTFQGTIMADESITLGAGTTLSGRTLARDAAVTLDTSTITTP